MFWSTTVIRVVLGLGVLLPTPAFAQVRASESASISQTIDGTKLTVTYSRPRARERDSLFGKVVTWGEVWTPGANLATTLEASKNIKLDGHPVPKGKYSVWMVVKPSSDWVFVLDPRSELYHTEHPDSTPQQIRFRVSPAARPFMEVLTWDFSDVRIQGTTLSMQWGTTYVPVNIEVEPSYKLGFPALDAARYVGRYDYTWNMPGDSAKKPVTFTVTYAGGSLKGRWDPTPFPEWGTFILVPIAENWFVPGFLDSKGALYEIAKEMVFEFKVEAGKATGLDVRGEDDKVMATAKRKS